jgi:membrane fusion protein, multidrug efflux system
VTPENENGQEPNNSRKKPLIIAVGVLMLAAGIGYYLWTRHHVSTDDAFVDGHIFSITPRVAGFVTEVLVDDNQEVIKEQPLLRLDPTEYEVALAEARANLAEAEFTLTSLELGVPLELTQTSQRVRGGEAELNSLRKTLEMKLKDEEAAAQELKRTEAERDKSAIDLRRMEGLLKNNAISQATFDDTATKFATAAAQVGAAMARLESTRKQKASLQADMDRIKANIELAATGEDQARIRGRQVEAQKSRVELANTRVRQAELNLSYTTIYAPAHGSVTRKRVETGLMVSRGQPLMAVVPLRPDDLWVTANYKETQLTKVRPGQPVTLEVDAYPGVVLKGTVDSIMAGTGAVFSLFPPENATGNFVKVVQRIPVKIRLERGNPHPLPALRVGMSVVPTILTDR